MCGGAQWRSPSGVVCDEGHGEVPSLVEAAPKPPRKGPLDWGSANAGDGSEKQLAAPFERIVEKVFAVEDPEKTYARLEKDLRVGEERSDAGVLVKALDLAETNARFAHRLSYVAKLEKDRWEMENDARLGAMRGSATRALEEEKEKKIRTKQITDADVEAQMALLFKDEYMELKGKRRRVELMARSLENLAETWASRCRTLQVLVGRTR